MTFGTGRREYLEHERVLRSKKTQMNRERILMMLYNRKDEETY